MLAATKYPVQMFANIVADANTRLIAADTTTWTGVALHYEHGHPLEIINTLESMTKAQAKSDLKFPLIALFQDYDEARGADPRLFSVRFHLVVCSMTRPEYRASERMTLNFIPTLYPIYDKLIEAIAKSGYFMQTTPGAIQHTKTDRMFWGKTGLYGNTANMFMDYIDAIEIQDLQLTVKIKTC